ncbi:MAG TPA: YiiX/YebB-like N1pC/P60 family cysteine hydrolase [Chitinophagaceae bacterium]|nr:YiiX/YebB-like N1pC/P60 family cysteine hydrolase [Chitinophagaceae bacterium]
MIEKGQQLVKDGDLVLRNGQEPTSRFISDLSRQDKSYSHAGIIIYENGYPMIYHIVTGDENRDSKLRRDSLNNYASPRKNNGFAIYRYNLTDKELNNYTAQVKDWYQQGLEFDNDFSLQTDSKMYCSEMILKGLSKATNNRIKISTTIPTHEQKTIFAQHTKVSLQSLKDIKIVAIDNLYNTVNCTLIKRFSFNQL